MLEARLRRAEYLSPPTLSLNADPDRDLSPNKRMDTMSNLMRYSLTIGLSCTAIIQAYAASATAPFDPGNPNWVKITGQDCWMYTFRLTDDSVTWTGSCSERCASGSGTATWHDTSGSVTAIIKGTQVNGVFKGKEVYDGHSTDGSQFHWEGRIENGKMQGNALYESYKNGTLVYRYVGNVVDGVQNGQGRATTYAYGTITSEFNGIWQDGRPATANNVASASPSDSSSTQTYPTAIPRSVAPAAADQSADHDADTRTISAFFHSLKLQFVPMMGVGASGYERIAKDPSASKFETKITVANGFLYRSRLNDQDAWKIDLTRLGYLKTARIWYQLAFSQLKQEHPEIDPARYPPPDARSPVPLTELPRVLAQNKGKEVGDPAALELRSFIIDGYKNFKDTPDDATIERTQLSLENARHRANVQEAQTQNTEAEKRDARLKALQRFGESAASPTLNDKAVIYSVVAYLNNADDQRLDNLKKEVVKLQESIKNCEKDTNLSDLPLNKSVYQVCQERDEHYQQSIHEDQDAVSNFKYRSTQYEITVAEPSPHNYEGNMISHVKFRAKGTDHIDQHKVTMQFKNQAWVVVQCDCDAE
jgi:hypothetical protein